MASKKKTAKKKATRNPATAPASASLPAASSIPEGFKKLGGGYADTWAPEIGDELIGIVTSPIKIVPLKQGRKTTDRRCMEVTANGSDARYTIWESATLVNLFDELGDNAEGSSVYLRFDGLGKKKAGQNPPKLFTVAIGE